VVGWSRILEPTLFIPEFHLKPAAEAARAAPSSLFLIRTACPETRPCPTLKDPSKFSPPEGPIPNPEQNERSEVTARGEGPAPLQLRVSHDDSPFSCFPFWNQHPTSHCDHDAGLKFWTDMIEKDRQWKELRRRSHFSRWTVNQRPYAPPQFGKLKWLFHDLQRRVHRGAIRESRHQ
jgi:hypothetical protein